MSSWLKIKESGLLKKKLQAWYRGRRLVFNNLIIMGQYISIHLIAKIDGTTHKEHIDKCEWWYVYFGHDRVAPTLNKSRSMVHGAAPSPHHLRCWRVSTYAYCPPSLLNQKKCLQNRFKNIIILSKSRYLFNETKYCQVWFYSQEKLFL